MRRSLIPVGIVLALGGCGGGASDASQVRATLNGFARAAAAKDYTSLCRRFLAPQLVDAVTQFGLACPAALARGLGGVNAPKLSVASVSVHGATALAHVHSTAANQPPSDDVIELVKRGGRWYVSSLVTSPGK